jgi:hypothetical protein
MIKGITTYKLSEEDLKGIIEEYFKRHAGSDSNYKISLDTRAVTYGYDMQEIRDYCVEATVESC